MSTSVSSCDSCLCLARLGLAWLRHSQVFGRLGAGRVQDALFDAAQPANRALARGLHARARRHRVPAHAHRSAPAHALRRRRLQRSPRRATTASARSRGRSGCRKPRRRAFRPGPASSSNASSASVPENIRVLACRGKLMIAVSPSSLGCFVLSSALGRWSTLARSPPPSPCLSTPPLA